MGRVVLVSIGDYGSTLPLIVIGHGLRARGHDVELVAHVEFERSARDAGLGFRAICDEETYRGIVADKMLTEPHRHSPSEYLERFATYFQRHFATLNRCVYERLVECVDENTLIVSDDHAMLVADLIARAELGPSAHRVLVEPAAARSQEILGAPEFRDHVFQRLFPVYESLLAQLGLPRRIYDFVADWGMPEWYRKGHVDCLALWPEWFEASPFPEASQCGFLWAGEAQRGALSAELARALRAARAPILFVAGTIGTVSEWDDSFFETSAEACRRLGRRALLVSGRRGRPPKGHEPDGLGFDFVPISRIAPLLAAVVHHGGMNGCINVLAGNTPQLLVPRVFGQPDNASRFSALGVASVLQPEQYDPATVAETLLELIESDSTAAECRRFGGMIRRDAGISRTCDWVEARMPRRGRGRAPTSFDSSADRASTLRA